VVQNSAPTEPQGLHRGINRLVITLLCTCLMAFLHHISDLKSNDVASIRFYEDAGAALLYGSGRSNGVIIIPPRKKEKAKPGRSSRRCILRLFGVRKQGKRISYFKSIREKARSTRLLHCDSVHDRRASSGVLYGEADQCHSNAWLHLPGRCARRWSLLIPSLIISIPIMPAKWFEWFYHIVKKPR